MYNPRTHKRMWGHDVDDVVRQMQGVLATEEVRQALQERLEMGGYLYDKEKADLNDYRLDELLQEVITAVTTIKNGGSSLVAKDYMLSLISKYAPEYLAHFEDDTLGDDEAIREEVSEQIFNNMTDTEKKRLQAYSDTPTLENFTELMTRRGYHPDFMDQLKPFDPNLSHKPLWTGHVLGFHMQGYLSSSEALSLLLRLKSYGAEGDYFDKASKYILSQ